MRTRLVPLLVLALLATMPGGASSSELDQARRDEHAAEATVADLSRDLGALTERYTRLQERANLVAARLIDAYLLQTDLQAEMAEAQAMLDERADAIYRAGPAGFLDVMLGSADPGDYLARERMIEGALEQGVTEAVDSLGAHERVAGLRREIERGRRELLERRNQLAEMRTVLEIRLTEAEAEAAAAGNRVSELEDQRALLAQALESEQGYLELVQATGELAELLEMLGPTGGRGCAIPSALEPTGTMIVGEASFYGEEFAGNPTAIGHIFNPELFTAAHKTLPLPSFMHVRYGDRCATVLVNDRGPYVEGRVIDLSEGAAMYLGLPGVGDVQAEVLAPRG